MNTPQGPSKKAEDGLDVTHLLHVSHVVGVVAVLHLLRVDVHGLLSRRERCLGRLWVGPRRHGGGRRGQG